MDKTKFAKAIAGFVIGGCTAKVVKEIILNNVSPDSVPDKAAVIIASYVIGAMASLAAKEWTNAKIDEIIASWIKLTKENETQIV